MLDRDVLYGELDPDMTIARMMGLHLKESIDPGDTLEIVSDVLHDAETGLVIPSGMYRVADGQPQAVHIVPYNPETKTSGGKEYLVTLRDMEQALMSGTVRFPELTEGLWRGYVRGTKADDKFKYNNMTHSLFTKGYLQLFPKSGGGHNLSYRRRAHKNYASGTPNDEYQLNRVRQQRRLQKERRKKIKAGAYVPRRKKA